MANREKDVEANDNIWSSILSEVQKGCDTKLPTNKSVLVLGDNASDKTSLITKLHGVEIPNKGTGLEYTYINVQGKEPDDVTRTSVWILDGDPIHKNLLRFALNEQNFSHTLIILTISMATPWIWMDQLQHWINVLTEHVTGLKIESEEKQRCQLRLITAWQNFCETIDTGSPTKSELPLPEGVLTNNLGLDVVIVVTKTDYMIALEKMYDFRSEHFDFMQHCMRRFCLMYGAALFYTSVKEGKNCDLLYQYLKHRIYGLPFRTSAQVVEKDTVLIPAGWDSMNKIDLLVENLYSWKPDDHYNDIIIQPAWCSTVRNREEEVQTQDEQAFFASHQHQLRLQSNGNTGNVQDTVSTHDTPTKNAKNILENFFNSLRRKKSRSPETVASSKTTDEVTGAGNSLSRSVSPSTLSVRTNLKESKNQSSMSTENLDPRAKTSHP